MSRLKRLIHAIHERSLWQILLVYIASALVCFEPTWVDSQVTAGRKVNHAM